MWNYSTSNSYPNIILHDCIVEKIRIEETNLIFTFNDNGFWINKDNVHNPFGQILRTGRSELKVVNIDMDYTDINIFEKVRLFNKPILTKLKNISLNDFISKVNCGEWRFEFVNEYYAFHSAMFCGYLHSSKSSYSIYTQIEIMYDEIIYYWNKIYEDRTW